MNLKFWSKRRADQPSYSAIIAGVVGIQQLIADMEAKDKAFFDAEVSMLSALDACLKWREKYPNDFPADAAEIAMLPCTYRLPQAA